MSIELYLLKNNMKKYRNRLLDEKLKQSYDSLTSKFPDGFASTKEFCDQIARKLNGAYRVGAQVKSNSNKTILNEVCRFGEIEQGKFFIYEGIKLCRFGCYGMGIDANGTVAKKLSDDTEVVKANLGDTNYINSYENHKPE